MSQIIKAFMGVFLTLFMAVTAMGILAAYMLSLIHISEPTRH